MTAHRSVCVLALLGAGIAAQGKPAVGPAPQPKVAIESALAKAKSHNKRALVVFEQPGGAAASALTAALKKQPLAKLLQYEFVVVRVDAAAANDVAKGHGFLEATTQTPAMLVLDADGKALVKLPAKEILADDTLNTEVLHAKLAELKAEPLDAEALLAAGLARAKKLDHRVFVRFDAPW